MADGTSAAPGLPFANDLDTGFYCVGANSLGIACSGVNVVTVDTTGVTVAGTIYGNAFRFGSDPNTGITPGDADQLLISAGGAKIVIVADSYVEIAQPIRAAAGTSGAPAYTFSTDLDTGLYLIGAGNLGLVAAGIPIFSATATAFYLYKILCAEDGTVSGPTYTFRNDYDTGFYALASYVGIGVAFGGINVANFIAGGIGIGTSGVGTSGTNVLAIAEGVAPTTSPTDVAQIYAANAGNYGNSLFVKTQDLFLHNNLLSIFPRREMLVLVNAGAATITSIGMAGPVISVTGTGSVINNDTAIYGPRLKFNTGTTANSGCGITGGVGAAYTLIRGDWDFDVSFHAQTSTTMAANNRTWVGLFSDAGFDSDSTPSLHYAAFRYATDVDGTAYWRCVTDNGSGTPTVTATTVNSTSNAVRVLRIVYDSVASEVKFHINGVLVATHTATLPTATQLLGTVCWITTLDTTTRFIQFHKVRLIHN